jgi:type V secretory pathway adhesin AidA
MSKIAGDNVGDGYVYDYVTVDSSGKLRLFTQECRVNEDGYIVAIHDPVDMTDAIAADDLAARANIWTLDAEHGDPSECIVASGETLVCHNLMRNEELDVR